MPIPAENSIANQLGVLNSGRESSGTEPDVAVRDSV